MKLKRFETDNEHLDYKRETKSEILNESVTTIDNNSDKMTKLELLAHISKNWNDDLTKEFESIRSLYKKNENELLEISNKHIEKIDNIVEKLIDNTSIDDLFEDSKILDTVAELTMKYGENEAIETIRIDEGKIVIDLLCDTDIEKSVTIYNGIELVYNKICSIPVQEDVEIDEEIDEELLLKQSISMNESYNKLF